MGFIPEMPAAAGEYSLESRRESFIIRGTGSAKIFAYEQLDGHASVELSSADIPQLRVCLDVIESGNRNHAPVDAAFEVLAKDEHGNTEQVALVRTEKEAEDIQALLASQPQPGVSYSVKTLPLKVCSYLQCLLDERENDLQEKEVEKAHRESILALLSFSLMEQAPISFVLEVDDDFITASYDNIVTALDLENGTFKTDILVEKAKINDLRLLHAGGGSVLKSKVDIILNEGDPLSVKTIYEMLPSIIQNQLV
jgi:hypothetical protein